MMKSVFKITAIFFLFLFVVAAFHEAAPGLCLSQNPGGKEEACPFCKLVHILIVLTGLIFLLDVQACQSWEMLLLATVPFATGRARRRLRGPPSSF
jgi:hypothetical protein